ncbi:GA-like domain-containing protein (plasmid) [Escherichia coli]
MADDKAAEVEAKVAAAESAEKAAEDELVKVNQDGVVGKAEAERLTELNDAVTALRRKLMPSRRWMVCRMVRSRRASVSVWINWTGSRYRR